MFALVGFSLVLAVTMQIPQWLHMRHPLSQGLPVPLNSDEDIYLARVQETLLGRFTFAEEPFTGHPSIQGTQFAFIERAYGLMFGWTGFNAMTVLSVMDSVMPVLVFLSLVAFFRVCGFRKWHAFGAAVVFCVLQLYNLNRPIHMRASFLPVVWACIGVVWAARMQWRGVVLGGALLGMLVSVYVWSFAFAWAFFGVYFLWEFLEWLYTLWIKHQKLASSRLRRITHTLGSVFWFTRPRKPALPNAPWQFLLMTACVGVAFAIPAISQYFSLMTHTLYEYGSFRSGMHPGHMPESIPYSVLFVCMVLSCGFALYTNYRALKPYQPAVVIIVAACIYMNQQVVHGIVFNFVSHGIFSLATAALCAVLLYVATRQHALLIGAVAACVYLAAIGYDGRYIVGQWQVNETRFAQQHLRSAIEPLNAIPRTRILAGSTTSSFIASFTKHDIVFSLYLKNVLMTHGELASRFCLTMLPLPPEERRIEDHRHLIFPDATAAFGGDLRAEEERLVRNACTELDLEPALALETYEISYIFWDKRNQPTWDVSRLGVKLEETASGDGWVLYRILP